MDFSACQTLELLRRKLLKALALLDSTANIVRGCKMHHKKLHARTRPSAMVNDRIISALDGYVSEINYYRSKASTLLQRCSGTASLVSTNYLLLNSRNYLVLINWDLVALQHRRIPQCEIHRTHHPGQLRDAASHEESRTRDGAGK